ncbi:ABC transporter ATP-binding protein [Halorhabdus salina]|uniref:ABC transporter ATP-binding protein n=1 Tax=Halorhabdus salina TaxID=2750670 RepID=UPI0015EECB7A|nr:ATP-binding cassette domain-containing protein [Halorhabdus salina]
MTDGPTDDGIGDRAPASDGQDAVAAETLALTYPDGTEAVRDVSLSIPRGESFGFLGPNGAGKTTTIKLLSTLLEPTAGTVRVNGFDVSEQPTAVRATVGYMAQEVAVDGELTARENLRFACDAYGVPVGDRAERIDDLLDLVDLADVADTPAERFSGGMKKRLDAATALVHDPQLVFLDEPTTGLDPKARNRLWEYVQRINDRGTTVFLTTQYLAEADELCDRLAVIRDGRIVERGSPRALKRRVGGEVLEVTFEGDSSVHRAAEIARGTDAIASAGSVEIDDGALRIVTERARATAPDLLVALREQGIDVTGIDVRAPSLEDVFFAIADEETAGLANAPDGEDDR